MLLVFAICLFGLEIILAILGGVAGMFIGNIVAFEGLVLGILSGVSCHLKWDWHPAICLLIGIIIFAIVFIIQLTKKGAIILGSIMTLAWTGFFGYVVYDFSDHDWTWTLVLGFIAFIIVAVLHAGAFAENRSDILERPTPSIPQTDSPQGVFVPTKRIVAVKQPPEPVPEPDDEVEYFDLTDEDVIDVIPEDVPEPEKSSPLDDTQPIDLSGVQF